MGCRSLAVPQRAPHPSPWRHVPTSPPPRHAPAGARPPLPRAGSPRRQLLGLCAACKRDCVVAFSCKGRGFCPSCGTRRMVDTAAWLVDRVIPDVPVWQWVLSLPYRVRHVCA